MVPLFSGLQYSGFVKHVEKLVRFSDNLKDLAYGAIRGVSFELIRAILARELEDGRGKKSPLQLLEATVLLRRPHKVTFIVGDRG